MRRIFFHSGVLFLFVKKLEWRKVNMYKHHFDCNAMHLIHFAISLNEITQSVRPSTNEYLEQTSTQRIQLAFPNKWMPVPVQWFVFQSEHFIYDIAHDYYHGIFLLQNQFTLEKESANERSEFIHFHCVSKYINIEFSSIVCNINYGIFMTTSWIKTIN